MWQVKYQLGKLHIFTIVNMIEICLFFFLNYNNLSKISFKRSKKCLGDIYNAYATLKQ